MYVQASLWTGADIHNKFHLEVPLGGPNRSKEKVFDLCLLLSDIWRNAEPRQSNMFARAWLCRLQIEIFNPCHNSFPKNWSTGFTVIFGQWSKPNVSHWQCLNEDDGNYAQCAVLPVLCHCANGSLKLAELLQVTISYLTPLLALSPQFFFRSTFVQMNYL